MAFMLLPVLKQHSKQPDMGNADPVIPIDAFKKYRQRAKWFHRCLNCYRCSPRFFCCALAFFPSAVSSVFVRSFLVARFC